MLVPGAGIVRMVCVELMKAEAKLKTRHAIRFYCRPLHVTGFLPNWPTPPCWIVYRHPPAVLYLLIPRSFTIILL